MKSIVGAKPKTIKLEAVKITADGQRIPLGTISYWSSNPLKRFFYWLTGKGV